MSSGDRLTLALVTELALVADGAIVGAGAGLAFAALRSLVKYIHLSSVLNKLRDAPCVPISGLRSLLHQNDNSSVGKGAGEFLVFVKGTVDKRLEEQGWFKLILQGWIKSLVDGGWFDFPPDALLNSSTGKKGVILQRTKLVPFVLKEGDQQSQSDYLVVNMEGSKHPLPLVSVYHKMQKYTLYTSLRAFFCREYTAGLLDEEKVLPIGNEITAVGVCCLKDGVPEIKSCNNLPYFLSEMGKGEMIADLSFRMKMLMWSGIVIGSISVGILGYAIVRNLKRRKERQEQARQEGMRAREEASEVEGLVEDEEGEVPEWNQCVVCLTRRRQLAFIPCGHLVCCRRCGFFIERATNPKCPVCRQSFRSSVRIYAS